MIKKIIAESYLINMWLCVILLLICLHIYINDTYIIHWVPPEPETWSSLNITKEAKRFWELEWSKSTFSKECSGISYKNLKSIEVVPVYFWPGERIDLPCKMCELSMAYNGKVKYWAKVESIGEFLKAAQINVITRKDLYEIVKNERHLEDPQ
ncbi:hypothetical protein DICVIV_09636 [Dictyocaulus viviparus]|uniref:Uncharacterized protein n=1 Tax=Dictyocaulus viviparus TaxID=29172 RepID=A0A0D8XI45_DICVI|nr:hypothetical protein DICVIV_09636 [Dictyocaulus viviparus]